MQIQQMNDLVNYIDTYMMPYLMSVNDAAEALGVTHSWLSTKVNRRQSGYDPLLARIAHVRIGGRNFFHREGLMMWVRECKPRLWEDRKEVLENYLR